MNTSLIDLTKDKLQPGATYHFKNPKNYKTNLLASLKSYEDDNVINKRTLIFQIMLDDSRMNSKDDLVTYEIDKLTTAPIHATIYNEESLNNKITYSTEWRVAVARLTINFIITQDRSGRYSVLTKHLKEYLRAHSLLGHDDTKAQTDQLKKAVKALYPNGVRFAGQYVKIVDSSLIEQFTKEKNKDSVEEVRVVSLEKIAQGIQLLLESGLFGKVLIK
jgi:hypothetical protein